MKIIELSVLRWIFGFGRRWWKREGRPLCLLSLKFPLSSVSWSKGPVHSFQEAPNQPSWSFFFNLFDQGAKKKKKKKKKKEKKEKVWTDWVI
jgi:hypothetical protein